MKKIVIIFTVIILVAGAAVFFFTRSEDIPQPEEEVQVSQLEILVEEPVRSPSLSFSGDTIWFFNTFGQLFRISVSGETAKVEFQIPFVEGYVSTIWQKEGSNFIVEKSVEGHTSYAFYDAQSKELVDYPGQLRKPGFLGSGEIVYEWIVGDGNNELKISDLRSENFRTITELFRTDYKIVVSPFTSDVVLFSENQVDLSKIFLVELATAEFRDLSTPLAAQGVKYSPDGKSLLVARWNSENDILPNLYLQDLESRNIFIPGVMANIEQTVWSEDGTEVYVADIQGIKKISVLTNEISDVFQFDQEEKFEPADLILNSNKSSLFFVNKKTGYLYRIDL